MKGMTLKTVRTKDRSDPCTELALKKKLKEFISLKKNEHKKEKE
ncbi:hypothetical protein AB4455_26705 [Vibrio sp. 10N.261.46.E12]|nr:MULTISPECIES: hypothetical protein [unclassified Vibrio]